MLDRVVKVSSVIGAILIFSGYLKLHFFYREFGIKILDYLTLSEIITSFLDELHLLVLFGTILLLQTSLGLMIVDSGLRHSPIDDTGRDYRDVLLEFVFFKFRWIYFSIFMLIAGLLLFLLIGEHIEFRYIYFYLVVYAIIGIGATLGVSNPEENLVIKNQGENEDEDEEDLESFDIGYGFLIVSLVVALFVGTYILARHDATVIKNAAWKTTISTDKIDFKCGYDSKYLFVGKSQGYYFISSTDKNKNIIIPFTEVDKISNELVNRDKSE